MAGAIADSQRASRRRLWLTLAFAAAALLLHEAVDGRYGYFRDELYFLDCTHHIAWGFVDFAPFSVWLLWLSERIFGTGLHGLRLLPALAASGKILLTGLIAIEFDADLFGTGLACLCVLAAPVYLVLDQQFAANTFEPLFWIGSVYLLILAVKRRRSDLIVWLGLLIGIGFLNKQSILILVAALIIGLLLSPYRNLLLRKWTWLAVLIALICVTPNLLWEYNHHWATIQELSNVRRLHKNVPVSPGPFLLQQGIMLNLASVLVWLPGLWFLLADRKGSRFRFLGIAFIAVLLMMMGLGAKDYYVSPIYPLLFAAGGAFWSAVLSRTRASRWLRAVLPTLVIAGGLVALPLALPVLPPPMVVRYEAFLGLSNPASPTGQRGLLPEHFGDEFGWRAMTAQVARVYDAMTPEDRRRAAILAQNYGEAGAIDFFGPEFGLPPAISAHQTYYLWGPRNYTGAVMIVLQGNRGKLTKECASVTDGPRVANRYAMAEEHFQIYVCRGLDPPLPRMWPRLKRWY